MPPFQIGDKVQCVQGATDLPEGREYEIDGINLCGLIRVVGISYYWDPVRFAAVVMEPAPS